MAHLNFTGIFVIKLKQIIMFWLEFKNSFIQTCKQWLILCPLVKDEIEKKNIKNFKSKYKYKLPTP